MTGHLFGAAGGIEAIIALQALRNGMRPPTINLDAPDEECDIPHIRNEAMAADTLRPVKRVWFWLA